MHPDGRRRREEAHFSEKRRSESPYVVSCMMAEEAAYRMSS
jgi:hypothetical protein